MPVNSCTKPCFCAACLTCMPTVLLRPDNAIFCGCTNSGRPSPKCTHQVCSVRWITVCMLSVSTLLGATVMHAQCIITFFTLHATTAKPPLMQVTPAGLRLLYVIYPLCCHCAGLSFMASLARRYSVPRGVSSPTASPWTPRCCLLSSRHPEAAVTTQAVPRGAHWAFLRRQSGAQYGRAVRCLWASPSKTRSGQSYMHMLTDIAHMVMPVHRRCARSSCLGADQSAKCSPYCPAWYHTIQSTSLQPLTSKHHLQPSFCHDLLQSEN